MGQQYAFKHAHVIRHVCMLLFLLPFMMGCEEDKEGSPDKPGGLSIQLCKSEKKEFYIRYSS